MCKVIDIFSGREIEDHISDASQSGLCGLENGHKDINPLEAAASEVCSAAAKLAIECEPITFETYLMELLKKINHYQTIKNRI